MRFLKYIIIFWATCDLLNISKLVVGWIVRGEIPIVTEVGLIIKEISLGSDDSTVFTSVLFFVIEVSLFISAYYLLKQKRYAAYMCYIQFPLRFLSGYSSLPFIQQYIYNNNITSNLFPDTIEIIKFFTIALWHYSIINKHNISQLLNMSKHRFTDFNTYVLAYLLFEASSIAINYINLCVYSNYDMVYVFNWRVVIAMFVACTYIVFRKSRYAHIALSIVIAMTFIYSFVNIYRFNFNSLSLFTITIISLNLYFIISGTLIVKKHFVKSIN